MKKLKEVDSLLKKTSEISLAVICALPAETDALISFKGICSRRVKVKNKRVYIVEMSQLSGGIVILTSGMGKIRAAAGTQFAIDHFSPRYLINFGTAGGVNPERKVGDIVIGKEYIEYDFHGFGNKPPFSIPDPGIVELAQAFPEVVTGVIATADQNGDTPAKKSALWEEYKAECCDWEGAAVVKVASVNKIKALAFRCISDIGCQDVYSEYKKNYKTVLSKSTPIFWDFVSLLLKQK
jgi:adenosylhomocysteine nucleosidase